MSILTSADMEALLMRIVTLESKVLALESFIDAGIKEEKRRQRKLRRASISAPKEKEETKWYDKASNY